MPQKSASSLTTAQTDGVLLPRPGVGKQYVIESVFLSSDTAQTVQLSSDGLGSGVKNVTTIGIGSADNGSFTLTFDGQTTTNMPHDSDAATVEAAVEALSNVSTATVTGDGTSGDKWVITVDTPVQEFAVTLNDVNLSDTESEINLVETTAGVLAVAEKTTVDTGTSTGGTFTLTYGGDETTAIPYNASAATVRAALLLLDAVHDCTVTGAGVKTSNPWVITMGVAKAIVVSGDGTNLTGGDSTLTVTETVAGVDGVKEVTTIDYGTATGGTFTLTVGADTTPELPYNATAAQIKYALDGLSTVVHATVTGTGVITTDPWVVTIDNPIQVLAVSATSYTTGVATAPDVVATTAGMRVGAARFIQYVAANGGSVIPATGGMHVFTCAENAGLRWTTSATAKVFISVQYRIANYFDGSS